METTVMLIVISLIMPTMIFVYLFQYREEKFNEISWMLELPKINLHYNKSYGPKATEKIKSEFTSKKDFILPLALLFLVSVVASEYSYHYLTNNDKSLSCAAFGIAGGFIWGIHNTVKRLRNYFIYPGSVHTLWLKIMLAGLLGYLIGKLIDNGSTQIIAFGIGAIPITETRRFIENQVRGHFKFNEKTRPPTLNYLQGINSTLLAKFEDFGIENIQNLAQCNLIEVFLRCNTERKVIIDLVDQALLWCYVEDKLPVFRRLGVRGAIELAELYQKINSDSDHDIKVAESVIKEMSTALEISEISMINLIEATNCDLQVILLWDIWTEMHYVESIDGLSKQ